MTRTEEEIGVELAALWAAVSKMASSLMWRTGQCVDVPVKQSGVLADCGDGTEGSGVEAIGGQVREDVGEVVVELAVPPGEARSFGPGECDMTTGAATAAAKPVVEVRPYGIAKYSALTESVCAMSPGEAGFYGSSVGATSRLLKLGLLGLRRTVLSPGDASPRECCAVSQAQKP